MKDITIRKAISTDFDKFFPFFKKSIQKQFSHYTQNVQAFYLDTDYSENFLKKELQAKREILYIAVYETTITGFLLTKKVYGGVGYAIWLAVDPEFQKHGCASSLLAKWENDTVEAGGHVIQLWTSKNNIPFYENRGFTLMGEFPKSWFGLDDYFFYKPLAPAEEKNYLREYLAKKKSKK